VDKYNAQCCPTGHVFEVGPDSPHYERCVAREKQGLLDALTVHSGDHCPDCREEREAEKLISEIDADLDGFLRSV
jgi:hypothetical protein